MRKKEAKYMLTVRDAELMPDGVLMLTYDLHKSNKEKNRELLRSKACRFKKSPDKYDSFEGVNCRCFANIEGGKVSVEFPIDEFTEIIEDDPNLLDFLNDEGCPNCEVGCFDSPFDYYDPQDIEDYAEYRWEHKK